VFQEKNKKLLDWLLEKDITPGIGPASIEEADTIELQLELMKKLREAKPKKPRRPASSDHKEYPDTSGFDLADQKIKLIAKVDKCDQIVMFKCEDTDKKAVKKFKKHLLARISDGKIFNVREEYQKKYPDYFKKSKKR
jgi:hypothetical protein